MSAPGSATVSTTRRRHLRPGPLVVVGDVVWLVDEVQPVAAVLDATTGALAAVTGWPEVPAGPRPNERRVFAADDGLWVQQPGGRLALIGVDGLRAGHHVSDLRLSAVSAHGAWCAQAPRSQDIAATRDAPPADYRGGGELRLAPADELTRSVWVDAPVQSIRAVGGDLYVEVETGQWSRRSLGTPTSWELLTDTSWLRLGGNEPVPTTLSRAHHAGAAPARPENRVGRHRVWLDLPDLSGRGDGQLSVPDQRAGGLDWYVGWDDTSPKRPRQVLAVAVETDTRTERWRIRLGDGAAVATAATHRHVWVAVQEPRNTATYSASTPVTVLRIDVGTGEVESVVAADSVDVTDLCWPMGEPPIDANDYAAFWRQRLSGLKAFWTGQDGTVRPLSEGLSDSRVDIVGTWPDTCLHVTFAWTRRPGIRLRRIIPLYDNLGRPEEPEYADIHVMEDLETGHVPPDAQPGAGYLDM